MEIQVDPQVFKKQSSRRTNELSFNEIKKTERIAKQSSNLRIEVNGKPYQIGSSLCVAETILFELSTNPKQSFVKLEGVIPIENENLYHVINVEDSSFFMNPEFYQRVIEEIHRTNDDFRQTICLSLCINDELKKLIHDERFMSEININLLRNSMKLIKSVFNQTTLTLNIESDKPIETLNIYELLKAGMSRVKQNESIIPSATHNSRPSQPSTGITKKEEATNTTNIFKMPSQIPQILNNSSHDHEDSKERKTEFSNDFYRIEHLVNNFCGESKTYVDASEIKARFIKQKPQNIKNQRNLFFTDPDLKKGNNFKIRLLAPRSHIAVNGTWISEHEDSINTISIFPAKPYNGFRDHNTLNLYDQVIFKSLLDVFIPKFQKSQPELRCQEFYTILIEDYLKEIKKNQKLNFVSQIDSKEFELQTKKIISSLELFRILFLNPRANQAQAKSLYVTLDNKRENIFRKKHLIKWLVDEIEPIPSENMSIYQKILAFTVKGQIGKANQTCIDEDLWEISNLLSSDNNDGMVNYLDKSLKPSISKLEKRIVIIYDLLVKKVADFISLKKLIPNLTWKEVLLCHLVYFGKELNQATLLEVQSIVINIQNTFAVDFNFYLILFFGIPSENTLVEMLKPSIRHNYNTSPALPYIVFLILSEIYLKVWKDCSQKILSFENSIKQ